MSLTCNRRRSIRCLQAGGRLGECFFRSDQFHLKVSRRNRRRGWRLYHGSPLLRFLSRCFHNHRILVGLCTCNKRITPSFECAHLGFETCQLFRLCRTALTTNHLLFCSHHENLPQERNLLGDYLSGHWRIEQGRQKRQQLAELGSIFLKRLFRLRHIRRCSDRVSVF